MRHCASCGKPHDMASLTCSRLCAGHWFNFMKMVTARLALPLNPTQRNLLGLFKAGLRARGEILLDWR